uniref:T-cell surface glycoprotein CD4 n=1 Tax=Nannospalax galili TaxID=1026970 RepID=A0A8C6RZA2_NANGA
MGRCKGEGLRGRQLDLLLFYPAQLPAVTQGKTVVIGKAGDSVELPCKASQSRSMPFSWKYTDNTKILESQSTFVAKAQSDLSDRVDSRKSMWDKGSFPLIINKLEMKDSKTYICEVANKKTEVELQVFKVTVHPDTHLLQGQSLTLTLEGPAGVKSPMECKGPENRNFKVTKDFLVPSLGIQDSGSWTCTLTVDQKSLVFNNAILVMGFQKTSTTDYKEEGKPAEFSVPLNIGDENLSGEIKWQAEKPSSLQSLTTFSVENKKVSVQMSPHDPKFELAEMLPLRLKLSQALSRYAGSGNLTLMLAKGTLHHKVNLVVVTVKYSQDTLICEVLGPTSPKMKLALKLKDQVKISKQKKVVQVQAPEAGTWYCELSEEDKVRVDAKVEVLPRGLSQDQPMFLAAVLGGTVGFLVFSGLCILCCVKCRHQRRQAERMSQIKRLLSEKKTCQCPQ